MSPKYNNCSIYEEKIKHICNKEYTYFFHNSNIVGVALGYKIKSGFSTKKQCIKVFVKKK